VAITGAMHKLMWIFAEQHTLMWNAKNENKCFDSITAVGAQ
jgi:hypothetical protein